MRDNDIDATETDSGGSKARTNSVKASNPVVSRVVTPELRNFRAPRC
jgi:hypothetical protein